MRKPKYMEELLKIIFWWLGAAFIFTGLLCFVGILKPDADSMIQESTILGIVFSLLGIAFLLIQAILKAIAFAKNNLHNELLVSGTKIEGRVEKVHLQRYTQYGRKSPYRIFYTYIFQGRVYHHKSYLLWDKPDLAEHDPIEVFTNNSGKSTIQL